MWRRERAAARPVRRLAPAVIVGVAGFAALAATGCRQDMHDQPKVKPLAENNFFADGSGARPIPAGAVSRGDLRADHVFYTGRLADDSLVAELPMPVTRELLVRGRERFDIFCSPCHGRTGQADGMVVRRGYKQPSSYHVDRLRMAPVGYFFDVMTNGFGVMPSYAAQVPAADRWAIAAYVRTLQLAQHFDAAKLSAEERAQLDAPPAAEPAHAAAH
jgi:mono/diheme cytochrome c family protein